MKTAVIGLCILGLVAAACAAVLINGLRVGGVTVAVTPDKIDDNPQVTVLVATRNAPAMTIVDGSMVASQPMLRKDAPADYLSNAVEVVGQVLSEPLVVGRVFTKTDFTDVARSKRFAAVIPAGKRAVAISVTEYAGLAGLLYPGGTVDVLVSFKPSDSQTVSRRHDAVTTTLLQNIQVLAFDQQTVLSPGKSWEDNPSHAANGTRRVTLLVDTKQAKSLELAMEQGTLSLALRNPMDNSDGDPGTVSMRSIMGEGQPAEESDPESAPAPNWQAMVQDAVNNAFAKLPIQPPPATQPVVADKTPEPLQWETTIIRGTQVETQTFPLVGKPQASSTSLFGN